MTKTRKKLCALAAALTMALALSAPAAAAAGFTVTIHSQTAGRTYEAYQIFAGELGANAAGETALTNIVWGSGVTESGKAALLRFGKAEGEAAYEDAAALAAALTEADLRAFAQAAENYLSGVKAVSSPTADGYALTGLAAGRYLIRDAAPTGGTSTAYMLEVTGDSASAPKNDSPDIDKVIADADASGGKGTALDVGGSVGFQLTSTVPSMDGYSSYTYIVTDTLSAGLTFNNDVAVTIGGAPLAEGVGFTVAQSGQRFTVTFLNFIDQKANQGKEIVITYSAALNEAALTTDVETNKASLTYSNNPSDSASTGTTTEKVVYVYDFDLVIDKYTGAETGGPRLSGAMFVLKNAAGRYYHWDDSSKKVEWVAVDTPPTGGDAAALKAAWEALGVTVAVTDGNGAAKFPGLDSGSYALKEITAPNGYALVKEDIPVVITAAYNADGTLSTGTGSGASVSHIPGGQYGQTVSVRNSVGPSLPETGGVGATIFYVVGGLLVVGAVVILITKKRMKRFDG